MAEYSNLSATINAQIRANGVQAITGPVLNAVLTAMVNVLGDGYRLNGVAVPADNPGSPDNRVAYLAAQDGTYTNFGGLTISGEVALLLWDSAWTKETLFSIDTAVTPGSGNLVTSGAVDSALTTLANNIAAAYMQLAPAATEGNLAEFGNAGQVRDAGLATSNLATKDGHYRNLFAGFAGNLVDTRSAGTRQGPFAFRQSGGDGVNYMRKILGRTEVFNQLLTNTMSSVSFTGGSISKNGLVTLIITETIANEMVIETLTALRFSTISGHKYLWKCSDSRFKINNEWVWGGSTSKYTDSVLIVDATSSSIAQVGIKLPSGLTAGTYSFGIDVVDLTLEGLGLTTADQFRALHPLGYYNYNAGVLKNNAATGLETTGFNQWDGTFSKRESFLRVDGTEDTGQYSSGYNISSYIPVIAGQTYYVNQAAGGAPALCFYDADKNFISGIQHQGAQSLSFTIPTGVAFVRDSISVIATDYCINRSDASRNGIYEPYWKREIVLGITGVTGIPEGGTEADRVTIFPNGMAGVGTAQDMFYEENGVAKARGTMGRKTISADTPLSDFDVSSVAYDAIVININNKSTTPYNVISNKYAQDSTATNITEQEDKSIRGTTGATAIVKDVSAINAGMTAEQARTLLLGLEIEYILATPVVYTNLQNADRTPFVFPKMVEVDNLGTEKRLPEDTADNPQAPFECDSNYSVSTANLVRLLNL